MSELEALLAVAEGGTRNLAAKMLNFARQKPNAMTAMTVRATNVRSLAAWSA